MMALLKMRTDLSITYQHLQKIQEWSQRATKYDDVETGAIKEPSLDDLAEAVHWNDNIGLNMDVSDVKITGVDNYVIVIDGKDDSDKENDDADMVLSKLMTSEDYNSGDIKNEEDDSPDDDDPEYGDPLEDTVEENGIGNAVNPYPP